MLRRPPTAIELKLDDIIEFEQHRRKTFSRSMKLSPKAKQRFTTGSAIIQANQIIHKADSQISIKFYEISKLTDLQRTDFTTPQKPLHKIRKSAHPSSINAIYQRKTKTLVAVYFY
ncbi:hypothetical protein HUJ04_007050 [Dendroctonus ponderosae]|nr:hypothetical protein HUJ04_007050 [Dendroctonus ponderosae]